MMLGSTIKSQRSGDNYTKKIEDLHESIGSSDFDLRKQALDIYNSTRAALLNYKKLNGHMIVPAKFIVPDQDVLWPEQTWNMKLGSFVQKIRRGVIYKDKREDLEGIEFNFNSQRVLYGYEKTKIALLNYKKMNGNMLVTKRFVVPNRNVEWPEETWSMTLGSVATRIRRGDIHKDKREDLESIGFDFNPQKKPNKRQKI